MKAIFDAIVASTPVAARPASTVTGLLSEEIDLSCWDDLDDSEIVITGLDVVAQDLYHVLIEPRASNLDDPDRGADIQSFTNSKQDPGFVASLPGRIGNAAEALPEIVASEGTAQIVGPDTVCDMVFQTAAGPFRMIFELTPDNVAVIKGKV
jgi:hypothetical protein